MGTTSTSATETVCERPCSGAPTYAGFSADPHGSTVPSSWIPYGYEAVNVEAQLHDPVRFFIDAQHDRSKKPRSRSLAVARPNSSSPKPVFRHCGATRTPRPLCSEPIEVCAASRAGTVRCRNETYRNVRLFRVPVLGTALPAQPESVRFLLRFELQRPDELVEVRSTPQPGEVTELSASGWRLFESEAEKFSKHRFCRSSWPANHGSGEKGGKIDSVRIRDWVEFRGYTLLLRLLCCVRYSDGDCETYSLPSSHLQKPVSTP
jgi:hypothetical protein